MRDSQHDGPCCLDVTHGGKQHSKSTGPTPAQDPGKAGIVRLFGGVFVGAVAEEMYRTFQVIVQSSRVDLASALPAPTAPDGVDASSSGSSDEPSPRALPAASHLPRGSSSPSEEGRQAAGDGEARPAGDGAITGIKRARDHGPDGGVAADGCTSFVSECSLPTEKGMFRLRAYRYSSRRKSHEPVVMVCGDVRGRDGVPVRVHDQCQTSEVRMYSLCIIRGQGNYFFDVVATLQRFLWGPFDAKGCVPQRCLLPSPLVRFAEGRACSLD